jgi:hypothetical protein
MNHDFIIRPEELDLSFTHGTGHRRLAFQNWQGTPEAWKSACRDQLSSSLGLELPATPGIVRESRRDELRFIYRNFGVENRVQMQVSPGKGHEMDIPVILKYLG